MIISENLIQETHRRIKPRVSGVWQDCFALLYIMNEFQLPENVALGQVAFGGNDYGIDAFHVASDLRNLYLYQFKWTVDHKQFADSIKRLTSAGIERVFGKSGQDQHQNEVLDQLKWQLHEKKHIIERVFIHCVFRGKVQAAEQSRHLEALMEKLEACRFFLDDYFGRAIEFTFEFVSVDEGRRGVRTYASTTHEFAISLNEVTKAPDSPEGHGMIVGFVPLVELHGFYKAMNHRLFDRNIRFGLSDENAPNRKIRQSLEAMVLKGTEPPEHFAYYHNGVSISAQAVREVEGGWRIIESRVLNGAQTITSTASFLERNEHNPLLHQNLDRFTRIKVLTKIVTARRDDGFVTRVTMNNNRQNPVQPWNLRANDDIQLQYSDAFEEQGIYYERQEGAFESLSDDDLEHLGVQGGKSIELRLMARTLLAFQGEIKKMSSLGEVFEHDKTYEATFRREYLERDLRELVVAYKIGVRARRMADVIKSRGENKWWYIRRGTNLLWALGIQAVLNECNREATAEEFGQDLRLPVSFTEMVCDLASKRIRPIIDHAVQDKYTEDIAEGKVSFLNSTTMFEECMTVAKRMYKWQLQKPLEQ